MTKGFQGYQLVTDARPRKDWREGEPLIRQEVIVVRRQPVTVRELTHIKDRSF